MAELTTSLLSTAVLAGGVIALAALGELLAERVGVFNIGLEGLMSIGAIAAIIAAIGTTQPAVAFSVAFACGFGFGLVFAFATVVLRANQVLSGLALSFFCVGLSAWIGAPYSGRLSPVQLEDLPIPGLSSLPIIGPAFFDQNVLVYFTYFLLPLAIFILLFKTRHGLNLRAVGENPEAADVSGISVMAMRFWYVAIGAALTSSAGAYLTLAFIPAWSAGMIAGRGWIALGLVIFANYHPFNIILGALLFGTLSALGYAAQAQNWPIAPTFLSMMPYVGTVAFMFGQAILRRGQHRGAAAPAAIGIPYFREDH